jgi:hypothetical protein
MDSRLCGNDGQIRSELLYMGVRAVRFGLLFASINLIGNDP